MKTRKLTVVAILILLGLAMGAQAQVTWQTSKTTINRHSFGQCQMGRNTIRVKVSPTFLDVEEDVEIGTTGRVDAGNDPTTLEINGTFNLPAGSAIIGSLLWDGHRILEGKLLDRKRADSLYTNIVNRDTVIPPIRPRDPLIIESIGENAYRFRVFPVALNFSRRMRIRYQLPPNIGSENFGIRLHAAIAPLYPTSPNIPVTLVKGDGPDTILLVEGNSKRQLVLPRTLFVAPSSLGEYSDYQIRVESIKGYDQVGAMTSFITGLFLGNYFNLYAKVPATLLVASGANTRSVSMTIKNSKQIYDLPITCELVDKVECGQMVFQGKSTVAWNDTLVWKSFDRTGRLLKQIQTQPKKFGNVGDTGIAVLWASATNRYSEKKELPAGPVYGFVDVWASLLALEKDSLINPRFAAYADTGVPRIVNKKLEDVIPNYNGQNNPCCINPTKIATMPTQDLNANWHIEHGLRGDMRLRIPGLSNTENVAIELYNLEGQKIGSWNVRPDREALRWNIGMRKHGAYILKIRGTNINGLRKIML